jgi:hexosaminidase
MTPTLTPAAPTTQPTDTPQPTSIPTLNNLIPKPISVAAGVGAFTLTADATVNTDSNNPELTQIGQWLAATLKPATGFNLPVSSETANNNAIILTLKGGDPAWGDEGYQLTVTSQTVTVTANQPAGLFHGLQTLRQLLPATIESATPQTGPWLIPATTITDQPRFAYRGFMLDVARHFFTVSQVERYIDFFAAYKLNYLHLHLSDDQGWRIEIKSWPNLTAFGSTSAVNGDPGGFYTQADYSAIVAYAAARYITIVPEIDLPGHTNAALASYPELNCNGKAPALYTGTAVGFSSLCVEDELTYKFIDDVVGEIAALTPGPYMHIGGDEAKSTSQPDYEHFMTEVQPIVQAHGKQMMGWEEISQTPGLSPTSVVQHWNNDLALQAVQKGAKVVMSPATKAYLDMKYDSSTPLGQDWAALIDEQSGYSWDPATQVPGISEKDILGVEAPLWTETLKSSADLDTMAFPRLLGIAEIAWSPTANRSWGEYKDRLATFGPRLTAAGINFYKSNEVPWP